MTDPDASTVNTDILRPHAEQLYAHELAALAGTDDRPRPPHWNLSPAAVVTYLLGGTLDDGTTISPKYIGPRRLVEVAVATLATDRALLLLGVPGTAKTWMSEHLTAAISGRSTLLIQGTAGTPEEAIRYGWNYARLLAEGPSEQALVPSPIMTAMREGKIARIEELTRIPSDVQDALITVLSEKSLPIPELDTEVQAAKGFSVIATANNRDRGVNDLSSALRRRFNTVVLPLPATADEEVVVITTQRLVVPGGDLDEGRPWHLVDRGRWDPDTDVLSVTWVDGSPAGRWRLTRPGGVPDLFRERVQASIVLVEEVALDRTRRARVVLRRDLASDVVLAQTIVGRGCDPDDPELVAATEAVADRLAEQVGRQA